MTLLRLTRTNGEPAICNPRWISAVFLVPIGRNETRTEFGARVTFGGSENDYFDVKETIEEVMAQWENVRHD